MWSNHENIIKSACFFSCVCYTDVSKVLSPHSDTKHSFPLCIAYYERIYICSVRLTTNTPLRLCCTTFALRENLLTETWVAVYELVRGRLLLNTVRHLRFTWAMTSPLQKQNNVATHNPWVNQRFPIFASQVICGRSISSGRQDSGEKFAVAIRSGRIVVASRFRATLSDAMEYGNEHKVQKPETSVRNAHYIMTRCS